MGDISELRGLVVLATFMGVTALLINLVPAQFYIGSELVRTPPLFFESVDLQSFASTMNFTLDGSDPLLYGWYMHDFELGGWSLRLFYRISGTDTYGIRIGHMEYWWIFPTGYHILAIYDSGSGVKISDGSIYEILTETKMITYWDDDAQILKVKASCSHTNFMLYFSYNMTTYSNIGEALEAGELSCFAGIAFDQVNTSVNVWSIFTNMLFFHIPDVDPTINALLSFGFWIAFAYIIGILALRIIGGIFGGGA